MKTIRRLLIAAPLIYSAFTNQTFCEDKAVQNGSMILNIPGNLDFPQENMTLTIQLPNKISPSKEVEKFTKKVIRNRHDYKSHPIEEISRRSRFKPIMSNFRRKRILTGAHDIRCSMNKFTTKEQAGRIVIKVFDALKYISKLNNLKRHGITVKDLKDLKELIDEFQRQIKMFTYQPTLMHQQLDTLIATVSKTHGKGTIQVRGIQESDDGTIIKLEISKE